MTGPGARGEGVFGLGQPFLVVGQQLSGPRVRLAATGPAGSSRVSGNVATSSSEST